MGIIAITIPPRPNANLAQSVNWRATKEEFEPDPRTTASYHRSRGHASPPRPNTNLAQSVEQPSR